MRPCVRNKSLLTISFHSETYRVREQFLFQVVVLNSFIFHTIEAVNNIQNPKNDWKYKYYTLRS